MQIFVHTLTRTISLDVEDHHTIAHIKQQVYHREGIPASQQLLRHGTSPLRNDHLSMRDYHLENGSTIDLSLGLQGGVQILIKDIGKPLFPLEVELSDTIEHLKLKIQQSQGVPSQEVRLSFRGKTLDNSSELGSIPTLSGAKKAIVLMTRSKTETVVSSEKPTLCLAQCGFYGNSATKGYCSKCFKDQKIESLVPPKPVVKEEVIKEEPKVEVEQTTTKEEEEEPSSPKVLQQDKGRCWHCKKKVGYLGFPCKCEYVFCAKHRYCNEHDCSFDYHTSGKATLRKANVAISAPKLEQI